MFMVWWIFGVIWWIVLSIVVGIGAENRGRSKAGYIVLSLLCSPCIGGFIVLVLETFVIASLA